VQANAAEKAAQARSKNLSDTAADFVVVYSILSRLLYLALSANLGLLYMPHPGMGP